MKINKISCVSNNCINNIKHSEKKVSFSGNLTTIPVDNSKKVLSKLPVLGASMVSTYALCKNTIKPEDKTGSEVSSKKITDEEMDKMFKDNGFRKTKNGNIFKIPSPLQVFSIINSFGGIFEYGSEVLKYISKPADAYKQKCFKDFLEIGNNREFIKEKNNFNKLYQIFSMLYEEDNFSSLNASLKENPEGVQVIQNFAKNPPSRFQALELIDYKGANFCNINKEMRDNKLNADCPYYKDRLRQTIRTISRYLDEQVIEKPIKLFRGEVLNGLLKEVKLEDGSTINLTELMQKEKPEVVREFVLDHEVTAHQPSFLSTSLDKDVTKRFVASIFSPTERLNGIIEITTKPNTKGAFLEYASNMGESEVLLNKDSDILIKDIIFNKKDKIWELKAEVSN